MPEFRTTNSVLDFFEKSVRERSPIDPHTWLDGALSLNTLLGDEQGKLFLLEQNVAKERTALLEQPTMTVAKAKVIIEASDGYLNCRVQKAKIDRIIEMVRLAKILARTALEEFKGN